MNTPTADESAGEGTAAVALIAPRQPRGSRRKNGASIAPWALVSPAGLVMVLLTVVPIVYLVYTSFTNTNQRTLFTGAYQSVGFDNYTEIFQDADFWAALARTVVFTAAMVLGSVIIGMFLSNVLVRASTVMRYVLTVVLIFAWAMPNVASSQVWNWLFQPGYGILNWFLTQLHVFGDMTQTNWAQNTWLGFTMIWLLVVWQAVPFIALTLYAAQSQVDPAYYEAARLDGASERRIYFAITIRFLAPTLLLISILSIIWDFNVFNQIWLLTQGGPDDTTSTLGVWNFKQAFVGFKIGLGSATAVVTTILLMIFTGFYIRRLLRSGEDL
ncbi:carbohydrate ABC transporter permease [Luteimicrobium subarcticum]|uniref:N,N'-diacetylchitobiose transport system permease protein n=1 Tax=Luteimicrobium subarcticum TaxID=620910 RepID=A0A2M8WUK2_9MICO|nr:sugar ABC transporter permease [Luteimicrobium subarcticum]PJI94536.1 N,N'-diacetylchitobiose transport system permease protein [Luteimicrobium subarcticum]